MSNILNEKFELIAQLYEIDSMELIGMPTIILEHSVLNTVDLFELTKIYLHREPHNKLIVSNILKRFSGNNQCVLIYDYVFDTLKSAGYTNRLRYRKILEHILVDLDETYKLEFFSYFFRSKYVYEIKGALKIARLVWNMDLETMLVDNYAKTKNIDVLITLIDMSNSGEVYNFIKNAWTIKTPNYLKAKFVGKLRDGAELKNILFLKDIDPGNFLSLLKFTSENIDDKMLMECYENVPEKYKPFAIWNLSRLGKWNLIKPLILEYASNPLRKFQGFSETSFD
ncbi:hypothetical protein [Pedobacter jamesrossensis]|uniref:3-methyladenine DNA glycosylase AlkC n=1 Tax=Pedobacter jamesrossensis TaxID=1908238 RepID=A0ABV8NI63_9SPHI